MASLSISPLKNSKFDFSLALHAFTASGVLVGMVALIAVLDGSPKVAIVWLLIAQLIDGIDGPLARRLLPEEATTKIDGYILDLVIDFVTCVIVPAAFLWEFKMVSHNLLGMCVVASMIFFSALWFSRTDQMDAEGWFRGFPAAWHMVVPTLWIFGGHTNTVSVVVLFFSFLTITDLEFAHPVRVAKNRTWNIVAMAIWISSIAWGCFYSDALPVVVQLFSLIGPMMVATTVISRAIANDSSGHIGLRL